MHASGEKIAMLTCYDAAFATLQDEAGVDVLLVGDSLGNVLQGQTSTVPSESPTKSTSTPASSCSVAKAAS